MHFKILILLSLCFFNLNCSLLNPEEARKDKDGYYINHYWSCGPKALNKAFKELDIILSEKKISREIQDSGNFTRTLLSLVHYDALEITLPSEIKTIIKKHGFNTLEIKDLNHLNENVDVAIILVAKNYLKGEAHWLCFPVDDRITNYFGENTRILKIFLLKKVD
tara:strand:- start:301 stop:795 length:495 start_codon:yes stop_codon:yes gene_type:complete